MLFNTIEFIFFLPVVIILYFILPHKFRWVMLLASSYYFYMCWRLEYVVLILTSTVIDYFCGIQMSKYNNKRKRRPYLILSIITNLGLLFAFKYANFVTDNINEIFAHINISKRIPSFNVLLPVGISFYTFQTLSYSIDVYNGKQEAEKHFGYFALFVSFFPQLVAGPIERFSHLTTQLKTKHLFNYKNLSNGFRLILYGLFIKMVIADNISVFVDTIYKSPELYSRLEILTGIFLYSFQIYCDFYGYSLVAIGSALLMDIEIMDNFKTPYLSLNISEFWQRWHISLSTWFRDYFYFPLGGNRVSKLRWILNILVVFIVSGIWHGANWTFLIWGTLFGVFYIFEKLINKAFNLQKKYRAYSAGHLILSIKTFILVSLIWVFFRSQSVSESMNIFKLLFTNQSHNINTPVLNIPLLIWIFIIVFIISDILLYNKRFDNYIEKFPFIFRWSVYIAMIFIIIVFSGVENFPFIYFQF